MDFVPEVTEENSIPDLENQKEKPWRYIGYRGFSEWTASSDDFLVIRRFDSLAARVIFLLQWEITKLERGLKEIDEERMYKDREDFNNGTFECDDENGMALIESIRSLKDKLGEYYKFVAVYSHLRSRGDASTAAKRNIERWLEQYNRPITAEEIEFITKPHTDLFSIVDYPRSTLRSAFEKLHVFNNSLFHIPCQKNVESYFTEGAFNYDERRVEGFVNITICVFGFLMLIGPLWILYSLGGRGKVQLIVITVCIAVFLTIVQAISMAKPFESLAATAAYSAVLLVFMQIGW